MKMINMKEKHLCLHVISFLFVFLLSNSAVAQYDYWISPDGSDTSGTGSSNAPWASIQKARDYLRTQTALTNDNININILDGSYVIPTPCTFTTNDSGRNGYFIIYRAVGGPGSVTFYGSDDINGWSQVSGNLWRVNVGTGKTIRTMYENNVRAVLARHPDRSSDSERYPLSHATYKLSAAGGYDSGAGLDWLQYNSGDFTITASDMTNGSPEVVWWHYGGFCDWGMIYPSLITNDVNSQTLCFAHSNVVSPSGEERYYVAGLRRFINQPGEFCYVPSDGWLYYHAYAGGDPSDQDIRVPVSSSPALIWVTGSEPGTHAHHLKFEGLSFACTSFGTSRQATISLRYTDHVEIRNCHIYNAGCGAIMMNQDCDHNLVYGCLIEHCGVGGVWVENTLDRTAYPTNKNEFNIISNCKIHDLGELYVNAIRTAGVLLFDTSDCEVSFCDIYNSARYATSLRGHWAFDWSPNDSGKHFSTNNTFKYIRATDCMQDSGDGGIIHAAHCNGSEDPTGYDHINYWDQILISGGYADPSMHDWAPNGMFFDFHYSCLYQNLSNIQISWIQATNDTYHPANTGLYRGNDNPIENQTVTNVNFSGIFDEGLMHYSRIGIKPDFPLAYDDQGTVILDDHTAEYSEVGTGWLESTIPLRYKGDCRGHSSGSSSTYAQWTPVLPFTRKYEVSIWKMQVYSNATQVAPYTICHQGGTTNVTINQQAGVSGAWARVGGTHSFAAGRDTTNGTVKLFTNPTDGKQVRADAIRFTETGLVDSGALGEEKGWWGFDFTNADASGYGHTAILHRVGYSGWYVVGTSAGSFNGNDDTYSYASIADHPDLDIGTGDFAITLWFRRDAAETSNLRILSKGASNDSDTGYCIWSSDTKVSVALCNGSSRRILTANHLGTYIWNRLAVNISRSGYMTLYINSEKVAEVNISDWKDIDISNSHDLNLGRNVTYENLYWPGKLDDVAVFQRVLSDVEIGL